MSLLRKLMAALALTPLPILLVACSGPSLSDYCASVVACNGGNSADKSACIDTLKTAREQADDLGCHSEYDDALSCQSGASTCRTMNGGRACMTNADCASLGAGAVCSNMMCQTKSWSVDPNNKTCQSVLNAYEKCVQP